ncbi:MAG: hypothetical protein MUO77_15195 [Anaerolineales bacterium]|nr:hypothetical protein [Anaerolineales bacterium]
MNIGILLFICLVLAACNLPQTSNGNATSSATIVSPAEGSSIAAQTIIDVRSKVVDPQGVTSASLVVNGSSVRDDFFDDPLTRGDIYQPWTPQECGIATIQVRLGTRDGRLVESSVINVTVACGELPISTQITVAPLLTETSEAPLTSTPNIPIATAKQDANCRLGPGTAYGVRSNLLTGQTAPITGRTTDSTWWVIQDTGSGECWIWGEVVTVTGDTSQVPVKTPPPLPTGTFTQPAPVTITPPAPLSAPSPVSPSGTLNCIDASGGVTLYWSAVSHPNGINHYEWVLEGPISDSGSTGSTQASTKTLSCAGANFQWRVRAVDGQGNIGPWSAYMSFNVP